MVERTFQVVNTGISGISSPTKVNNFVIWFQLVSVGISVETQNKALWAAQEAITTVLQGVLSEQEVESERSLRLPVPMEVA